MPEDSDHAQCQQQGHERRTSLHPCEHSLHITDFIALPENIRNILQLTQILPLLESGLGIRRLNAALRTIYRNRRDGNEGGESRKSGNEGGELDPRAFTAEALGVLKIRYSARGMENFRGVERPILLSNHPLGILDALVLVQILYNYYEALGLIANNLLQVFVELKPILYFARSIRSSRQAALELQGMLAGNATMIHFPAGLCSRRRGSRVLDLPWNTSYIHFARRYNRPIVPCFFYGRNSAVFYTVARLRSLLGCRLNIESYLLLSEVFKKYGTELSCRIGRAIYPQEIEGLETERANYHVRRRVYALETV